MSQPLVAATVILQDVNKNLRQLVCQLIARLEIPFTNDDSAEIGYRKYYTGFTNR